MRLPAGKCGSTQESDSHDGARPLTDEVMLSLRNARFNDRIIREATTLFPHFDLTYDEVVSRDLTDLLRFLGVDPAPLTSPYRRQRRKPQSHYIANYSDLKAAFAGTEWAAFFTG
jgi:hypothetical protein